MFYILQRGVAIPVRALAWLGGQGTRAIAALVLFGIAIPPLGELLRPFVTEAVFVLLCISFMRVDISALRDHLRRPGIVLAATAWTTLGVPLIIGASGLASGLDARSPDLFLALMLQVASPMMASPALAAVMGLDSTLVLVTLVTSTALVPFSAPLFAYVFFGAALTLSPLGLGLKLVAILAGSLLVAASIRWSVGASAIKRHAAPIRHGIQYPDPVRFRRRCHGQAWLAVSWPIPWVWSTMLVCICGVFRAAWRHSPDFPKSRMGTRARARLDGLTAQHGTDAGGDRRRRARDDVALFLRSANFRSICRQQLLEAVRAEVETGKRSCTGRHGRR